MGFVRAAVLAGACALASCNSPALRASANKAPVSENDDVLEARLAAGRARAIAIDAQLASAMSAEGEGRGSRNLASVLSKYSVSPIFPSAFANGSASAWFANNAFQLSTANFGAALSISADGSEFVVGSPVYNFVQLGKIAGSSIGLSTPVTSVRAPLSISSDEAVDRFFANTMTAKFPDPVAFQYAKKQGNFGLGVSMSDDGDVVVVNTYNSKQVFMYTNCSAWKCQLAYTFPNDGFGTDDVTQKIWSARYGWSVSVSPNGKYVAIGDPQGQSLDFYDSDLANATANNLLVGPAKLPNIEEQMHRYGFVAVYNMTSCTFAADGTLVITGVPKPQFIYSPVQDGAIFGVANADFVSSTLFQFGFSVAINSDGTRVVAGATNNGGFTGQARAQLLSHHGGYAYIFHYTTDANDDAVEPGEGDNDADNVLQWIWHDTLTPVQSVGKMPSGADSGDSFGYSIAVREFAKYDGDDGSGSPHNLVIAVGAPGGTPGYAATIYKCFGKDLCERKATIPRSPFFTSSGPFTSLNFGQGIAISADAATVAISGKYHYVKPLPITDPVVDNPTELFYGTAVAVYALTSTVGGAWTYTKTDGYRGYGWGDATGATNDQIGTGSFFTAPVTMSANGKTILLGNPVSAWKYLPQHDAPCTADATNNVDVTCGYALGIEAVTVLKRTS